MRAVVLTCFAAALLALRSTSAAVHNYNAEPFDQIGDAWILKAGHEGMYRSRHHTVDTVLTPKRAGTNDGKSFVKLTDLSFRRPAHALQNITEGDVYTGFVEVLVFERSQQPQIGYATEDGWNYCCDEDWAKQTKVWSASTTVRRTVLQCPLHRVYIADALPDGANEPVSAISAIVSALSDGGGNSTQRRALRDAHGQAEIFGEEPAGAGGRNASTAPYEGFPWRAEVDFLGKDRATQTMIEDTVAVRESGVYSMWFVSCDPGLAEVYATGRSVWKNPRGYLPGERQPLLPFHAALSLLYAILALTWLALHVLNARHVFPQQHLITLCLALGMLEACMDYADVHGVNTDGANRVALMVAAAAVAGAFRAAVRVTVLLLSRGFGTLRPSGVDRSSMLLGGAYFLAAFALDAKLVRNAGDEDAKYRVLPAFRLPVAALDAAFALAISQALYTTLSHLRAKGSRLRLCVYRCFAGCLMLAAAASVGYIGYESSFHATHALYEKWRYEWMHATFWHLVHFAVTAMLCILWAPGDLVAVFQVHAALLHSDRSDDEDESTPLHGPFESVHPSAQAGPREGNAGRARVRTKTEQPVT